jgi:hypothetical protein
MSTLRIVVHPTVSATEDEGLLSIRRALGGLAHFYARWESRFPEDDAEGFLAALGAYREAFAPLLDEVAALSGDVGGTSVAAARALLDATEERVRREGAVFEDGEGAMSDGARCAVLHGALSLGEPLVAAYGAALGRGPGFWKGFRHETDPYSYVLLGRNWREDGRDYGLLDAMDRKDAAIRLRQRIDAVGGRLGEGEREALILARHRRHAHDWQEETELTHQLREAVEADPASVPEAAAAVAAYRAEKAHWDRLRYASARGKRFVAYVHPGEFCEIDRPELELPYDRRATPGGVFQADHVAALTPADLDRVDRDQRWLRIVTCDPAMLEAIRQKSEFIFGMGYDHGGVDGAKDFRIAHRIDEWLGLVARFQGGPGALPARGPDDEDAPLPLAEKRIEFDSVRAVEVRPGSVAVPRLGDGTFSLEDSALIWQVVDDLAVLVGDGFPEAEAMHFVGRFLKPEDAARRFEAARAVAGWDAAPLSRPQPGAGRAP